MQPLHNEDEVSYNPETVDEAIGANIHFWRTLRGFSQKMLGEALDPPVTAQQISKFEFGQNRVSSSQLVGVAKALGIGVTVLFNGIQKFLPDFKDGTRSKQDGRLITAIQSLPDPTKKAVANLVEALAKQTAEKMRAK